jgi:thioredoxin
VNRAAGAAPIHVTDDDFEAVVRQAALPLLVDFWAPWWGPCRVIAPVLEALAAQHAGRLLVVKAKVYEAPRWAKHYRVRGLPTLLFMRGGQEVDRHVGMVTRAVLEEKLARLLGQGPGAADASA